MAITFYCACGQGMQALEENAGKRVKCPACQAIMHVPGEPARATVPAAPALEPAMAGATADYGSPEPMPARFHPGPPPLPAPDTMPVEAERTTPQPKRNAKGAPPPRKGMAIWMKLLVLLLVVGVLGGGTWLVLALVMGNKQSETARNQLAVVPRDAAGFLTFRVDDIWKSKILADVRTKSGEKMDKTLREELGVGLTDIDRVTLVMATMPDDRRPEMPEMWGVVHTKAAYDKDKLLKLMRDRREEKVGDKTLYVSDRAQVALYFAEKEIWFGTRHGLSRVFDGIRKPATTGPLTDSLALAAGESVHGVLAGHVPEFYRSRMRGPDRGFMPPGMRVFGDMTNFTISFSADTGAVQAVLQFTNAASAREAVGAINLALGEARRDMDRDFGFIRDPIEMVFIHATKKLLRDVTVEARDKDVILKSAGGAEALVHLASGLAEKVDSLRWMGPKSIASANLRRILMGMQQHHDNFGHYPPARWKSGLSWRVAILPYIDQKPLYDKFRLEESWDSPHNKALLNEMPDIFKPVGAAEAKPGYTCYQVFTGDTLLFHRTRDTRPTIGMITDGTSNTFLVVEAAKPVPWTAPEDIEYEPFLGRGAAPALGCQIPDMFLAGFGDSTVAWIPRATPRLQLDVFIDHKDGRPIPPIPGMERPGHGIFPDFGGGGDKVFREVGDKIIGIKEEFKIAPPDLKPPFFDKDFDIKKFEEKLKLDGFDLPPPAGIIERPPIPAPLPSAPKLERKEP